MPIHFTDHVAAEKFIEMAENVAAIKTKLEDLPELKKKVERHERAYNVGKWAAVPVFGILNLALKQVWSKIGL